MIKAKFKKPHTEGIRHLSLYFWPYQDGVLVTATYKNTNLAHSIKIPNTIYNVKSGFISKTWYTQGRIMNL